MSTASTDLGALDEVRVRLLGKKGLLTEQLKGLGALSAAERPAAGQRINDAKAAIHAALEMHRIRLEQAAMQQRAGQGDHRCHLARAAARSRAACIR